MNKANDNCDSFITLKTFAEHLINLKNEKFVRDNNLDVSGDHRIAYSYVRCKQC